MFAGIDTHKDTLAVAVVHASGRVQAAEDVPSTEHGFEELAVLFDRLSVTEVGT